MLPRPTLTSGVPPLNAPTLGQPKLGGGNTLVLPPGLGLTAPVALTTLPTQAAGAAVVQAPPRAAAMAYVPPPSGFAYAQGDGVPVAKPEVLEDGPSLQIISFTDRFHVVIGKGSFQCKDELKARGANMFKSNVPSPYGGEPLKGWGFDASSVDITQAVLTYVKEVNSRQSGRAQAFTPTMTPVPGSAASAALPATRLTPSTTSPLQVGGMAPSAALAMLGQSAKAVALASVTSVANKVRLLTFKDENGFQQETVVFTFMVPKLGMVVKMHVGAEIIPMHIIAADETKLEAVVQRTDIPPTDESMGEEENTNPPHKIVLINFQWQLRDFYEDHTLVFDPVAAEEP